MLFSCLLLCCGERRTAFGVVQFFLYKAQAVDTGGFIHFKRGHGRRLKTVQLARLGVFRLPGNGKMYALEAVYFVGVFVLHILLRC